MSMEFLRKIASVMLAILSVFGINFGSPVVATPYENRVYTDGEMNVQPNAAKHLDVTVLDEGKDIFAPYKWGYRYGPSIMVNADGSIDAWFAAPGAEGEWDWITYKHSPDGGSTWTDEKKVLGPTAGSDDFYSTCDPGAVKFGDYYYIGYTSTTNADGILNHVYVARSKYPEGPYEKWNGSGWGGNPKAIVTFNGNESAWGAGEPSFIVKDETLYIYYTWKDSADGVAVNETRVATADAADENWPATICYVGKAITYADMGCDSADVKYIDDYGKFIAISTSSRLAENSYVSIYESDDGFTFTKANDLKTYISYFCHNSGISSRPNGHIRLCDNVYIAYAYGPDWGVWATRMHKISISLTDVPDFSDSLNENSKRDIEHASAAIIPTYIGITTDTHVYNCSVSDGSFRVRLYKVDECRWEYRITGEVTFSDYDANVIEISEKKITPLSAGSTFVTATWNGMSTTFLVNV